AAGPRQARPAEAERAAEGRVLKRQSVLVVVMAVRARTGLVRTLSAAWLAVVAATARARPRLLEVVGQGHLDLGGEGGVVVAEVLPGLSHAGLAHGPTVRLERWGVGRPS